MKINENAITAITAMKMSKRCNYHTVGCRILMRDAMIKEFIFEQMFLGQLYSFSLVLIVVP